MLWCSRLSILTPLRACVHVEYVQNLGRRPQGAGSNSSEAVSRHYTHIDAETKRAVLDKLPDVTRP